MLSKDDASKKGSDETAVVARSGRGKSLGFHPEGTRPRRQ
jgi:1-acyl-sn-glycerol-3-phosphate acyltransferase